jgi:hypothetical protein
MVSEMVVLTDAKIKAAKLRDTAYKLADSGSCSCTSRRLVAATGG